VLLNTSLTMNKGTNRNQTEMKHTLRDWVVYLGIALAIVLGIVFYADSASVDAPLPTREFSLIAFTALVFGYVVKEKRKLWRSPGFWVLLAVFLALHLASYLWLVSRVPLLLLVVLAAPEFLLISILVDKTLGQSASR